MLTEVKICGLSGEEGVDAALEAGADLLGFVFFARSPRNVDPARAAALAAPARGRAGIVALLVDPTDATVADVVDTLRPDLLQLHGSESAERIADLRRLAGRPVIKAIGVAGAADLETARACTVADRLLLDAKAPAEAERPGGNGAAFDWTLLAGFTTPLPWLLSGGLHPGNVAAALAATGATAVDVSSGVERAPGHKDPALIHAFVRAARAAAPEAQRRAG